MTLAYDEARDEMFTLVKSQLTPLANAIVGYNPEYRYKGVPKANPVNASNLWFRLTVKTVTSKMTAHIAGTSKKQFTTFGNLFIDVFVPLNAADFVKGSKVAQAAKTLLEKGAGSDNITFRNTRINELDEEVSNYGFQVVSEFEYETVNE